jgi:thioredoxin reductase
MTGLGSGSEKTAPGDRAAVDVIVAGGGLAGLAGALTLARARRSVRVFDEGHPRNAPAARARGYLTRDGMPPLELLAAGRAEIAGYGGQIVAGTVTPLALLPGGGLHVMLADGTSEQARRGLVATGPVDEYPDLTPSPASSGARLALAARRARPRSRPRDEDQPRRLDLPRAGQAS